MDNKILNKYFGKLKVSDGTGSDNIITNFAMIIYDALSGSYDGIANISTDDISSIVYFIAAEYHAGRFGSPGEKFDDKLYFDFIEGYRNAISDYGESQANVMLREYLLDQLVHHSIYNSKSRLEKCLKGAFNFTNMFLKTDIGRTDNLEINIWDIPQNIRESIRKQYPTDYMIMETELLEKLATYWISERDYCNDYNDFTVPADLIWANTLPIKDMIIECKRSSKPEIREFNMGKMINTRNIRILQFKVPDIDNPKTYVCMLAIVSLADGSEFVIPFGITNDESDCHRNSISVTHNIGVLKYGTVMSKTIFTDPVCSMSNKEALLNIVSDYIPVWYGIQVGLLNPAIKEVFDTHTNPKYAMVDNKKDRKGKTKTKIKYVKRLNMSEDVFEEALTHSYIRTKLCWYVTGHWREYKSGKRVFIQGYWKGTLRDTKNADIREREIVFPEKETDVDGMEVFS